MTRKRGRPKKAGARFPSGQRKVASKAQHKAVAGTPNEAVLARRRLMLARPDAKANETRAAENPLDCMEARGWIPQGFADIGHAYANLCRRVGHTARKVTASLEEAPETSGVDARRIVDMTPEEIGAIWAVLERRGGGQFAGDDGNTKDVLTLHALWMGLGPDMCAELNAVCVNQSWPFWSMHFVARGVGPEENGRLVHDCPLKWARKRGVLIDALSLVRAVLRPGKPKPEASEPERDHPFLSGPIVEEVVAYVDDNGQPDPVTTRSGREVEVVRRRRAG